MQGEWLPIVRRGLTRGSSDHREDDLAGTVLARLCGATFLEREVPVAGGQVGRSRSGCSFLQREGRGNGRNELAGGGQVGQGRHPNLVCFDDDAGQADAALGRDFGERREGRRLGGHQDPARPENVEAPGRGSRRRRHPGRRLGRGRLP